MSNVYKIPFSLKDVCKSSYKGFTLLEVIISLSLSLFFLANIIHIFFFIKNSLNAQYQQFILKQDIESVGGLLTNDIKNAGYQGCYHGDEQIFQSKVTSNANGALIVKHASLIKAKVVKIVNNKLSSDLRSILYVATHLNLNLNQSFILSDCIHAEIIQFNSIQKLGGLYMLECSQPLKNNYSVNAELRAIESNNYHVRIDGRSKSLYVNKLGKQTEKLIVGLKDITIKYVVVENNQLQFLSAKDINEQSNILGVEINLIANRPLYFYAAIAK